MTASLAPGFMVLQSNHLENLRDILVNWLAENPLGPLEDECILVQSNGIAQWLRMALADDTMGQGIAAAVNVQLPGRFIWQAYRSIFPELPSSSPFDKAPLTWRIYQILGELDHLKIELGEQANHLAPLENFLNADKNPRRLHQLAARLADLYDQYQLYRSDWLAHWSQGEDTIINPQGEPVAIADEQRWQPLIWRLAEKHIAQDFPQGGLASASRSHVQQAFIQACKNYSQEQRPKGLPRRVVVFSISSLPKQTLDLLQAISPFTQVMVFVTNPSQYYWGDLIDGRSLLASQYKRLNKKQNVQFDLAEAHKYGHPLLASWGKQARDFLHLLDEHDEPEHYRRLFQQQNIDVFSEPEGGQLLQQLQSDILNLRPLQERIDNEETIDATTDRSLQFTIAHSPQREVEILHDQLLASFAAAKANGTELNPKDILVMTPNIDQYAPHINAVFGRYALLGEHKDPRFLPFHITDQARRGQNTLLIALEQLLNATEARFTVSELTDLLDTPAIRKQFGFAEEDIAQLRHWIIGANIRWGLDAEHRASLGLPKLANNTWLSGIQRMLLGYASGEAEAWQNIQPYDEVSGLSAALVGQLSLLLDELQQLHAQLSTPHDISQWPLLLSDLCVTFFAAESDADTWALTNIEMQLEHLQNTWQQGGLTDETLPLEVVREELLAGLDEPTLSQRFLAGSINFATLMPMRALPFKQIWLLGMNDNDYPRPQQYVDFDLMANDYRPGDRSRREDDRYLFLEALLSAREKLVISWVGKSIRNNDDMPPSVLVNQLRDHISDGWQSANGKELLPQLTTEHPLQAFSPQYFLPQRDPRLFTYAKEWRQVHNTIAEKTHTADIAPWQAEEPITLSELTRFIKNPVQYFYQHRLGISFYQRQEEEIDSEVFTLSGLDHWAMNAKLLANAQNILKQHPEADVQDLLTQQLQTLERMGDLPLGGFSASYQSSYRAQLHNAMSRYQDLIHDYPQALSAQSLVMEHQGITLADSLADIRRNHAGNYCRFTFETSSLYKGNNKNYARIANHWVAHLLAQCIRPMSTVLISPENELVLLPVSNAKDLLQHLLAAYHAGMQEPLPLPCKTAFAYCTNNKADEEYEGGYNKSGERESHPGYAQLWPTFTDLLQDPRFDLSEDNQESWLPLIHEPLIATLNLKAAE